MAIIIDEVVEYINNCDELTKVYIGCDSERFRKNRKWYASYTTVIVIHKSGNKGCKVFGETVKEADFCKKLNRPSMRMMNEVYKASDIFLQLSPLILNDIEIHVDINPNEKHGSHCAYSQALGYVKGVCGVTPKFKPESLAASCCADRGFSIHN